MKERSIKFHSNQEDGFSLVEVIISLAVVSIFLGGVFEIVSLIQEKVLNTQLSQEAHAISYENMTEAKRLLTSNFFATTSTATPSIFSQFSTEQHIKEITQCRRLIESLVTWKTDFSPVVRKHTSKALVASPEMLERLGGDCGGNDFSKIIATSSQPAMYTSLPHTGVQFTGLDMFRGIAFISAVSVDELQPDLIALDAKNNFQVISSLHFGVGTNAIDVANGYVFVAQHSSTSQLAIIDARSPSTLQLIASTTLPGVAGERPQGWSITHYDSKIYIGTKRTIGHEFHIFDVSNPYAPQWLGSREINHNINSITVRGGIAYLATSGNARDLFVLDVSDPAHIIEKTTVDLPGNEDGKSLYLIGNTLYLGRFKTQASSPNHDFYALDVSDISAGTVSVLGFYDVRAEVNAIRVVGPYAFIGTSDVRREFIILDISSTTAMKHIKSIDLASKIVGVDYENGKVSAVSFDAPEFNAIDLK